MDIKLEALLIFLKLVLVSGWPQIYDMNVTVRNQTVDIYANIVRDISRPFIHIELLQDSGQRNFDLVAYRTLSQYTELPKRCPFRKKHYKFLNVTTDPEMLPPFLPDHRVLAKGMAWIQENGKKIFLAKGSIIIIVERVFKNNKNN